MQLFIPFIGAAVILGLIVGWKTYVLPAISPQPVTNEQRAQQETKRIIDSALDRARQTQPAQTAPQQQPGWPKYIVTRSWSSPGNTRGETGHEVWSAAQVRNFRQHHRPDPGVSETMRISHDAFYSDEEIVRYAISLGIVVRGYTARQGNAIVPQRR